MKNSNTSFYSRYSTWLGHATFAVLTLMAFAFFKERTLILDASLQSFAVLHKNDFAIQVNRFGAVMTQIFPLITMRLGGSLATILTAYSLSFVLVHWGMFWLCNHILKQKEMAFAIVLFNVFMVNNTFFWVQNEVIQAISLGFVFWSLLLRRGSFRAFKWFDYPLCLGILMTLVYFHPLFLFPFAFVAVYFLIDSISLKRQVSLPSSNFKSHCEARSNQTSNYTPLSILLILVTMSSFILITIFKNKITPNFYDTNTSTRIVLNESLLNFILRLQDIPSFKDFKTHLWSDFSLLVLSLVIISVFYLIKKRFLKLLLMWLSVITYTLIVMISYREGGSWFHIESQYLPMSIFVIVPLVWELIPSITNTPYFISDKSLSISNTNVLSKFNFKFFCFVPRNDAFNSKNTHSVFSLNKGLIITTIVISIAILSRLIDIYQTRDFYKKRLEYIGELLEKTKALEGTKFILAEKYIDKSRIMQSWCMGYETLYYSALQSPDSMRTIAVYPENEITFQLGQKTTFQAMFNSVPYSELNPRLFHQLDTINPYKLLTEKDIK